MIMSRYQNAGQSYSIKISNKSFQNMGKIVTDRRDGSFHIKITFTKKSVADKIREIGILTAFQLRFFILPFPI